MKYLCILLAVAAARGFVLEESRVKRSSELPTPRITSTAVSDPADVTLKWTAVQSDDPQDPVLGYKVKVWEYPDTKVYKYEIIDGVKTLVEESVPATQINTDDLPTNAPKDYVTDKTTIKISNLKFNVPYEFRVQAYSKGKESKLSDPVSVTINPKETSNQQASILPKIL